MIFTKLRIRNFGKLKELELPLGAKLNIIYGPNEAGKSTILAFIKAMFYGMNSQKKDLRENDRLRFQPWDGDFGEGELYFQDEKGRELFIRRKIGSTRGDYCNIFDALTGQRLSGYTPAKPGEAILGLGEAAFSRTIYVPQLGCLVSPDKEDEIMARLMNLQQTGEEQISLQKALTSLEKERKKLTLRSGNGKLDSLRSRQADLRRERERVQRLYDENIADQAVFNKLFVEKEELQRTTVEQEGKRLQLKKLKQYLEYRELEKYEEALQALQRELSEVEGRLICGESPINAEFLQEVQHNLTDWRHKDQVVLELEKESNVQTAELEKAEAILAEFKGFAGLDENISAQLLLQEQEEKRLKEKLSRIEKHYQEKTELEQLLAAKKTELGSMVNFYDLTSAEEEEIAQKENLKRQLEDKLKHDRQIDTLRRDFITDKLKRAKRRYCYSLVAVVGGLALGLLFHPLSFLLVLFGVIVGVCGFLQRKKHKATLAEIETQLAATESDGSLQKDFEAVVEELKEFYRRFGAANEEEFREKRRIFESINGEIEIIKAKLADRLEQLALEKEEEVRKQFKRNQEFFQHLFSLTLCNSSEEFNKRLTEYIEYKVEKENVQRRLVDLQNKITKALSSRAEVAQIFSDKLGLEEINRGNLGQAELLLQSYEGALSQKNELTIRLASETKNFEERLAGRNMAELAAALEGCHVEKRDLDKEPEELEKEEEMLELSLLELNEERLALEKKITEIESTINNRFQDVRDLARVEEELALVAQQIKGYEEILAVLDLIKEVLTEAFQELQNSFGPILNNKVGLILQEITGGKYGEVKVAENYRISIKECTESVRDLNFFSNGTLDQVYFALRLGIIALAYNQEQKLPLILDDTFIQYDDERLAAALTYLLKYAEQHQVLLFTCHQRETKILQGKKFNYISLV
jgi:exonuclease SbcC